ncbi:hypothetical protein PF008_g29638 [Phytophthora fragariae]|uniref:Uncharacterized protein n=1 Tax=Phytophthora fragariae TaxID=53985 RepID=A0A6G0Q7Z0_9STRA|nr:hypothetical protein PF008_g29638 [Phytophthora fragariae]
MLEAAGAVVVCSVDELLSPDCVGVDKPPLVLAAAEYWDTDEVLDKVFEELHGAWTLHWVPATVNEAMGLLEIAGREPCRLRNNP